MTGRWEMHAGRDEHNGGFCNVGHPRYVEAFGHAEVVPVVVTEDPDGPYYGWLGSRFSDWAEADTEPCMIQRHAGIFSMQFPCGPDAEAEAGKGRVVRLTIEESHRAAAGTPEKGRGR